MCYKELLGIFSLVFKAYFLVYFTFGTLILGCGAIDLISSYDNLLNKFRDNISEFFSYIIDG